MEQQPSISTLNRLKGKFIRLPIVRKIALEAQLRKDNSLHTGEIDREIIINILGREPDRLKDAGRAIKADKELVLAAVTSKSRALEYADNCLQDDVDVVLLAVIKNATAYQFASDRLKNKASIVRAIINQSLDNLVDIKPHLPKPLRTKIEHYLGRTLDQHRLQLYHTQKPLLLAALNCIEEQENAQQLHQLLKNQYSHTQAVLPEQTIRQPARLSKKTSNRI